MEPKSPNDLEELRVEFDRCWPWLWASLCEFGPTHTKEQVWYRIYTGKAFLWAGKTSAIIGEIIDWPIGLRDFHYWLQGGVGDNRLDELLALHPGVELWAMSKGCHRATGQGREGWVGVMAGDWKKGSTRRVKWLTEVPFKIRQATNT